VVEGEWVGKGARVEWIIGAWVGYVGVEGLRLQGAEIVGLCLRDAGVLGLCARGMGVVGSRPGGAGVVGKSVTTE